jgi:hypothetical protein
MSDNLPNIELPVNEWVDLYQLSGIEVGIALSIENIGVCDVYVAVQATKPDPDHDSYNVLQRKNGVRMQNNAGDHGAWAFCNSTGGKVSVQPEAETGFYPHLGAMLKNSDGNPVDSVNPLPILDVDAQERVSLNTVFGEKIVGIRHADIASQFQYGYPLSSATPEVSNGGTIATIESMLTLSTGVDVAGSAAISNRKALRYLPGHEAYSNFTTVFTSPKADSYQRAGLFDSNNGFFIGYEGTVFKVTRRRDGVDDAVDIDLSSVFDEESGVFDPTKGNVYRISFGYLGFAAVNFEVMQPCGCWRSLHRINYPNTATETHILNTNLQPRAEVANTGNDTDIVIKSGSFTAGVVNGGGEDPTSRRFTFSQSNLSITSGILMVVTFRSKSSFAGLVNYISSVLTLLSFNTDLSKSTLWEIELNSTITNTPTWVDVDTADSTIEYSVDATVTQGSGVEVFSLPMGRVDRELITDLQEQEIELLPNDHITLFIISPLGTTGTFDLSLRWKELF